MRQRLPKVTQEVSARVRYTLRQSGPRQTRLSRAQRTQRTEALQLLQYAHLPFSAFYSLCQPQVSACTAHSC